MFMMVKTPADFTLFLRENLPRTDTLIVKANWVEMEEGAAGNLDALRRLIEAAEEAGSFCMSYLGIVKTDHRR